MRKPSKMQERLAGKKHGSLVSSINRSHGSNKSYENYVAKDGEKTVIYMSRDAVHRYQFKTGDILISISDTKTDMPDLPLLKQNNIDYVDLHFDDYVTTLDTQLGLRQFTREDADLIGDLLKRNTDARNIIVHCNYGESRSRAVAIAISHMLDYTPLTYSITGRLCEHDERQRGNDRVMSLVMDQLVDRFN